MAFITRNASITLLFMIFITLAFLIGSTVSYQVKLVKLNQEYDAKVAALKEIQDKAAQTTDELNQAVRERELRQARGATFAKTYGELKSEQETAEAMRDRLILEGNDLETAITGSQREYVEAKAQESQTTKENQALEIQQNVLMEQKLRKENTLRSLKNQLDELQATLKKLKENTT
ncbi:MAG: hypothetical protein AABX47_08830 [Nanoarchaeota archaeon]